MEIKMSESNFFIPRSKEGLSLAEEIVSRQNLSLEGVRPSSLEDGHVYTEGSRSCEVTPEGWLISSKSDARAFAPAILLALREIDRTSSLPASVSEPQPKTAETTISNPML